MGDEVRKDEGKERIVQLLEEILKWTKIEGMKATMTIFDNVVKTDLEKIVYENSNGQKSREIASIAQTSHVTVVNYWRKWAKFGIVEEVSSKGGTRYKRVFSLKDFGIDIPSTKQNKSNSDNESAQEVNENE